MGPFPLVGDAFVPLAMEAQSFETGQGQEADRHRLDSIRAERGLQSARRDPLQEPEKPPPPPPPPEPEPFRPRVREEVPCTPPDPPPISPPPPPSRRPWVVLVAAIPVLGLIGWLVAAGNRPSPPPDPKPGVLVENPPVQEADHKPSPLSPAPPKPEQPKKPAPGVEIVRFVATPETVDWGSPVEIEWKVENATGVLFDAVPVELEDRRVVPKVEEDRTFRLTAKGPGGERTQAINVQVAGDKARFMRECQENANKAFCEKKMRECLQEGLKLASCR